MNSRKQINKHIGTNQTAFNLACKAIRLNGIVKDGLTSYEYDKESNTLKVSDGLTTDIYKPCVKDDDLIFPFYQLLDTRYNESKSNDDEEYLTEHWQFKG